MTRRIDNIGFGNLQLVQNPDHFCYGVDAVLLAHFAASRCGEWDIAYDLGTGNGIIPMILSSKNPKGMITGIDVVESNIELARESTELNKLEERVNFTNLDVLRIPEGPGQLAQLVTCNPPYFKRGGGIVNDNSAKFIARQETTAQVDDFVKAARHLLVERGHFFMIHRPDRLVDIMDSCRRNKLEPKELQFVAPREGAIPNMVMLHCIKGAGHELRLLKTINVHDRGNDYTPEILEIYGKM